MRFSCNLDAIQIQFRCAVAKFVTQAGDKAGDIQTQGPTLTAYIAR